MCDRIHNFGGWGGGGYYFTESTFSKGLEGLEDFPLTLLNHPLTN